MCTAGPQPETCPAQCAPLDLNLGPAQLSVHRYAPLDLHLQPAQLSVHLNLGPSELSVLDLNCGPAQPAPLDLNGQI